jgi:hypothetical protein
MQVNIVNNPYHKVLTDEELGKLLATSFKSARLHVEQLAARNQVEDPSMGFVVYDVNTEVLLAWAYFGGRRGYDCVINAMAKDVARLEGRADGYAILELLEGDFGWRGSFRVNDILVAGSGLTEERDGELCMQVALGLNRQIQNAHPPTAPPVESWIGGAPHPEFTRIYDLGQPVAID